MNLKQILLQKIQQRGGWVNTHAHFDRAYTLDKESFKLVYSPLRQKWDIVDKVKRESTVEQIYTRMVKATEHMLNQGVQAIGTFIDVDDVIRDKSIKAAQMLKDNYGKDVKIKFMNQTLKGVLSKEAREWFDIGAEFVDIIGGLPGKDAGREAEHLDVLLETGKKLGKMVHVHVDQLNVDDEKETELLARKTIEHGMQGRVAAVHCISVAAHPKTYREQVYQLLREAQIIVVACPIAWIDHPRTERLSPTHSAVTPVDELIPAGIRVAIGVDNICDVYKPFADGDMWMELKLLLESCKLYDLDALADIATTNGLRALDITV